MMNGRDIAGAANDRIVRPVGGDRIRPMQRVNEWDEPHVGRPSHHTTRSCVLCVSTSLDSPRGGCWAVARETDPLMMPQGVVPEGSEGWWSVDLLLAGQHCTLPCMMRVANVQRRA